MSMLAERRTKKKWCLNPNGKDWSNDDNKFGQRMLEKMGWKKGCGLGANLQGMKEHVRVFAKNDTKGLGCKNNSDTEWIHHQQNFENLLSELACSTIEEIRPPGTSETNPVSLEEKSKKSRVRVHYQKFTRGKDVSRYSANDLACIFGKKCISQDSKSFERQYSCHTRNISEADSQSGMISDEHTVGQSLNLCEKNTSGGSLSLLLPKHRAKDQLVYCSSEDKAVLEMQNDILKEISNVKENSVVDLDIVQECKSEMEDNSASHSWSESLEKIRSKRKRKYVKDSENNQEIFTKTTSSSLQDEVNECDTVAHDVEETGEVEEEKKKRKKKKKHKKNKAEVEDDNGKEANKILIEEHIEVVSDVKETGNTDLKNVNVTSEADTRKKKKHKKNKAEVEDDNGKEDNKILIGEHIEVVSDAKETGNEDLQNANVTSEADTRKKKKHRKNKAEVEDDNGKEDNKILIEEHIEVVSDAKETGNEDLQNVNVTSEADTRESKIKIKKIGKLYKTHIYEEHRESPEMMKRKEKKMCSYSPIESHVVENIKSDIVSPLLPDNKAGVNNMQRSTSFTSEQFSSYKEERHQYDSNSAVKHRKAAKKLHSKSMEFGFRGSNLNSISGYGSL